MNIIRSKFQVIDTGIGIEDQKLSTIFESFNQGDNDTTRKYGGTGLGLSISKHLVDLFGGALEVQTKKAIGTKFIFTLRLNIGQEADLVTMKEHSTGRHQSGRSGNFTC